MGGSEGESAAARRADARAHRVHVPLLPLSERLRAEPHAEPARHVRLVASGAGKLNRRPRWRRARARHALDGEGARLGLPQLARVQLADRRLDAELRVQRLPAAAAALRAPA